MEEMNTYLVALFAGAAEAAGTERVSIELPSSYQAPTISLRELGEKLRLQHPNLEPWVACSRWAVDHKFVDLDTTVTPLHEVALIPPVSGG